MRRWLDDVANAQVHATTKAVPAMRFAEEQGVMLPAPGAEGPACATRAGGDRTSRAARPHLLEPRPHLLAKRLPEFGRRIPTLFGRVGWNQLANCNGFPIVINSTFRLDSRPRWPLFPYEP